MRKIIPRDLIKHLEWQPGQEIQPITTPQAQPSVKSFGTENITYSFLEGDFGNQILNKYNQLTQDEYHNASALQKLTFSDSIVKGGNPFAFTLLNKVLQSHGMWVARPLDLERALETDAIDLKGTYGDSGLVLRSESNPNEYLAKHLASQIKTKGYEVGKDAIMLPLAGLELVYDASSPSNLAFQLTDSTQIIYAPQLNKSNHGKKFNKGDEQGLPIFEEEGSRTLYASRDSGLSRLYRGRYLNLNARDDDLAYSYSGGRVIVCAEGTVPKV